MYLQPAVPQFLAEFYRNQNEIHPLLPDLHEAVSFFLLAVMAIVVPIFQMIDFEAPFPEQEMGWEPD